MANGHGGARPGAGRKKKATVEEQASRRDILLRVISPERWAAIVENVAATAERGEIVAILPYLAYLMGSPKQEHEHTGAGGGPFRIVIETVDDRSSTAEG